MLRPFSLSIRALLLIGAHVTGGIATAQTDGGRIVARVNDDSISVERFNASYVQHLIQTGRNDTPQRRYAHLNDLIDIHLLAEEARRRNLEDASYREYIDIEIRKIVGGRFFGIAFADSFPDPREEEVLEAFRRTNEQVVLRHLFFSNPDEAAAAYARLRQGQDFVTLANEVFGTAGFDSTAGYLGVADYWDLDDAVAEVAFSLPIGEYSEPVRSRYGWHILRVEDRIRNPLLTQDEFARRREDLTNRVRARRFRLEGGRFVRTFMDSLRVEVNVDAMNALRETIRRTLSGTDDTQPPRITIESSEVAAIEDDFSGESVLATYESDGRRQSFTTSEYFEWIGHLPYGEIRNRTAASVGRALRNQALANRGLKLGLQEDARVREEVEHRASTYLADALRTRLRQESNVTPLESELEEAYERLDFRRLETAEADFWHIPFDDPQEAEAARDAIADGSSSADSFPGYIRHDGRDLTEQGELGVYVRKAPLATPVVIGTGDGTWHVVRVDQRRVEYMSFKDARDEIDETLRPYLPEMRLVRALREKAAITVNVELFEEIMLLTSGAPAAE